jgi:hypothetical protein
LGDEGFGFDNNQQKKSNDLKRLITADPKKTGRERKRERQQVTFSEGELGRGEFQENLRGISFVFYFLLSNCIYYYPCCLSLLPSSERRNGDLYLRTALNGFLVFVAGWHAFSNEQNLLFISHRIEYLLCKAWREGVGVQRPMFSPIYPPYHLMIYPIVSFWSTRFACFIPSIPFCSTPSTIVFFLFFHRHLVRCESPTD